MISKDPRGFSFGMLSCVWESCSAGSRDVPKPNRAPIVLVVSLPLTGLMTSCTKYMFYLFLSLSVSPSLHLSPGKHMMKITSSLLLWRGIPHPQTLPRNERGSAARLRLRLSPLARHCVTVWKKYHTPVYLCHETVNVMSEVHLLTRWWLTYSAGYLEASANTIPWTAAPSACVVFFFFFFVMVSHHMHERYSLSEERFHSLCRRQGKLAADLYWTKIIALLTSWLPPALRAFFG